MLFIKYCYDFIINNRNLVLQAMKKLMLISTLVLVFGCQMNAQKKEKKQEVNFNIEKTDAEWKAQLSDEEYRVLRQKGTERPGTGEYNLFSKDGTYKCAACGAVLFNSDSKFYSECGWPSFDNAVEGSIKYIDDYSLGMHRIEIVCANCGGHLGHVFDDGPTKTGKRYCVNSVSIDFKAKDD